MSKYIYEAKKLLKKENISFKEMRVCDVKGFASDVVLLDVDSNQYVLKVFKDSSLEGSLIYKANERCELEIEMYSRIKGKYVPKLISFDKELTTILIERIVDYKLFTEVLLNSETITEKLFINIRKFFEYKYKKLMKLKANYYSYKDAKFLKGLYVNKKYNRVIDALFKEGNSASKCINHAGLSPKNIFVNDQGDFKIIDFEDSFVGDYVYDPGFLLGHIILYSIITENSKLFSQSIQFATDIKDNYALIRDDYKRMIGYAGLMLLHRADGFNLEGEFSRYKKIILEVGDSLLTTRAACDF